MAQVKVGLPGPPYHAALQGLFLAEPPLWRMEFLGREDPLEPAALSIFLTLNMIHVQGETNEPAAQFINLSHLLTCPGPQCWRYATRGAVIV